MTNEEIINLGLQAEQLLGNDAFNDLFAQVSDAISREIIATSISQKDKREELYSTYNGMRAFAHMLHSYVSAKNNVVAADEQLNKPDEDDDTATL